MKTYIDSETGELVEVQEEQELALQELKDKGIVTQQYLEDLENLKLLKEKCEYYEMMNKEALKEIFVKYNITSIKSDNLTITYRKEHMTTKVDTKKLKDDGLYDKYTYLAPTKDSISFKLKDDTYGG